MQILRKDLRARTGILKIKPENATDLYILTKVIDVGDEAIARTKRRIHKIGTGNRSGDKGERISVMIRLDVEEVSFSESSTSPRLRIRGKIKEATDERVSINSWHTFNIESGSIITIEKENWLDYHFKLLDEASKAADLPLLLFVAIEMGKATLAIADNFQVKLQAHYRTRIPRKSGDTKRRDQAIKQFFSEILVKLKQLDSRQQGPILLGGSHMNRQAFLHYIHEKAPEIQSRIIEEESSSGDERGINEMIKRGVLDKIAANYLFMEEKKQIDEFQHRIQTDIERTSYGLTPVIQVSEMNAIETLLLTDKLLRSSNPEEQSLVSHLLYRVEKTKGKVFVIDHTTENGLFLKQFGEIIALLRFPIYI
ncbi:MAG: mRNA surveillance protein pelota [Promethearchaeota archaeon]